MNSDHCCVTVQWLFSKNFQIAWNVYKRCLTVGRRSRELQPLSRDRSVTFFKKKIQIAWNVYKRCLTVAWPFSDFFLKMLRICLKRRKKRCLTVGRRSHDLQPLMRDRWATFFKIFLNCLIRRKNLVWKSADGRVTVRLLCYRVCFVRLHIRYRRMLSISFLIWLLLVVRRHQNLLPVGTMKIKVENRCYRIRQYYVKITWLWEICKTVFMTKPMKSWVEHLVFFPLFCVGST